MLISVLPGSSLPKPWFATLLPLDTVVHIGCYAVLLYLVMMGLHRHSENMGKLYVAGICAIAAAGLYGLAIELIQEFVVVERSFEIYDLVANMAGCIIGYGLFRLVYLKRG